MRILVVEDEKDLNRIMVKTLSAEGYSVDSCYDGETAVTMAREGNYDLIILDLMMPKKDGLEACQEIRSFSTVPIIMLTARSEDADLLMGFESGADDYVTKPFPISVFQKKVSALLSRITKQSGGDFYDDGNLLINFSELTAAFAGQTVTFTPLEYRLLKVLTSNSKQVLTRGQLLEKLWDAEENYVDEHALTSAISRIRGKIEVNGYQYIKTVYGMGYMWIGGLKK